MAKIMEMGKQIDSETGEIFESDAEEDMRERHKELGTFDIFGVCKYCHQSKLLQFNEEVSQEYADLCATGSCDCKAAKFAREREERLGKARSKIEEYFGGRGEDRKVAWMNEGLQLVNDMIIDRLSVNIEEKSMSISMNAKGNIKTSFKEQKTESIEA